MTPEERYLFDVQGFLLVEDVLTAAEVAELNSLLDQYNIWENKGTGRFTELWSNDPNFVTVGPAHTWDEAFRRVLDHPRVIPYLAELLEPRFRYDQGHVLLMRKGAENLRLHGGGTPYRSDFFYHFREGKFYNGMVAVSFTLTDAGPGQGGFAAIPGSHKANYPCPADLLSFHRTDAIIHVPARAGSAIIFTEALTHGTWPWKADYERRSLLLKYTPGHIAWSGVGGRAGSVAKGVHLGQLQPEENGWTERQLRLLTAPYYVGRPDVISTE
jgi:hypothetical protein